MVNGEVDGLQEHGRAGCGQAGDVKAEGGKAGWGGQNGQSAQP